MHMLYCKAKIMKLFWKLVKEEMLLLNHILRKIVGNNRQSWIRKKEKKNHEDLKGINFLKIN